MTSFLIRFLDFVFAFIGLFFLSPILVFLWIRGYLDTGSPLFIQTRVGKNQKHFSLVKFRTMRVDTPSVGSHEVSVSAITNYGKMLRRTKLDELPQLWNVLIGQMSLVGPRPNLPNQNELIRERDLFEVYSVRPGITGLAQVQNIDMSTPKMLAQTDSQMIDSLNVLNYFKYIFMTVSGKGAGDATLAK